ncbi:hypothetical protein B0H15DRAFT_930515 [Mycena belliarum]|uniref:DUF6534 domain-containing protein n=1 Tax=Mycena belliarum TaxID=1033014 RepID=A0AAD6UA20_9AGAR|nr:hypothetical protein B0H15DRAFT_930515 [Mycena belliae]
MEFHDFDAAPLTIPLFIGTIINWALLGALVVQLYLYFVAFPKDTRFAKGLVAAIAVAEFLETMGNSRDMIRTFGTGWGNPKVLDTVGWAWFTVPVLGSAIASAGQLFFAWRIYVISRSVFVPIVIAGVSAVQLGAGIWTGVLISRAQRFSLLQFRVLKPPVAWLAATALADLIIVAGTIYYLSKARDPDFSRSTNALLHRIIKITVETGLLCALFAIVDLALFIKYDGNNFHLAVCVWLSKVYSNSILVILNSRAAIGHAQQTDTHNLNLRSSGVKFESNKMAIASIMTKQSGEGNFYAV